MRLSDELRQKRQARNRAETRMIARGIRPDYIERKIDLALQRQRHAREAAPDCGCALCLADRHVLAETLLRLSRERNVKTEAPF
jgi:hypothetical protein